MLVEGSENKLGALFRFVMTISNLEKSNRRCRVMNRSKGRGKLGMDMPALVEAVAATPSPNKRRKRLFDTDAVDFDKKADSADTPHESAMAATYDQLSSPANGGVLNRRPSLTAPDAAVDLRSTVFSFMDSMDIFSPAVPHPRKMVERRPSVDASTEVDPALLHEATAEESDLMSSRAGQVVRRLSRRLSQTSVASAESIQSFASTFADPTSSSCVGAPVPAASTPLAPALTDDPNRVQEFSASPDIVSQLSLCNATNAAVDDEQTGATKPIQGEPVARPLSRRPSLTAPAAAQDIQTSVLTFVDSMSLYSPSGEPPLSVESKAASSEVTQRQSQEVELSHSIPGDGDDDVSVLSEGSWHYSAASSLFPIVSPACSPDRAAAPHSEEFGSLVPLIADQGSATTSFESTEGLEDDGGTTKKPRRGSGDSSRHSGGSSHTGRSYVYASRYSRPDDKVVKRKSLKTNVVPPKVVTQNMTSIRTIIRQAVQKAEGSPPHASHKKSPSLKK